MDNGVGLEERRKMAWTLAWKRAFQLLAAVAETRMALPLRQMVGLSLQSLDLQSLGLRDVSMVDLLALTLQ